MFIIIVHSCQKHKSENFTAPTQLKHMSEKRKELMILTFKYTLYLQSGFHFSPSL